VFDGVTLNDLLDLVVSPEVRFEVGEDDDVADELLLRTRAFFGLSEGRTSTLVNSEIRGQC
jgi:hypothetical protein